MSNNIRVSVIIPTYNRANLLRSTLESIKDQNIEKCLFEVLVIDDGSVDSTEEITKSFSDKFSIEYLYQEDKGYRAASARNLGVNNSKGEISLFIDSGMILGSECIKEHIDSHMNYENKIVIGYMLGLESKNMKCDREIILDIVERLDPDEAIENLIKKGFYDIREEVYEMCNFDLNCLPAPWALFWTGNISVKKNNILNVGLFDTNFDLHWGIEDIDLGYRLFLKNLSFTFNRKASSIHVPHDSNVNEKIKDEYINKSYLFSKYNSFETKSLIQHSTLSINYFLNNIERKLK